MRVPIAAVLVLLAAKVARSQPPDSLRTEYIGGTYIPQLYFSGVQEAGELNGPVRFTLLCFEFYQNVDHSKHFGHYFGMGWRHVGYIRDMPDGTTKKFRTWNLSIPIGVKVGRMQRGTWFAGYRFEWPFNYWERTIDGDEVISRKGGWVSKRTPTFGHVVELGYQLPFGLAVKAEYHLNNFHRTSYVEVRQSGSSRPYEGMDAHIVAISFIVMPFKDVEGHVGAPPTKVFEL